jgi:hypothetical protein
MLNDPHRCSERENTKTWKNRFSLIKGEKE